MPYQIKFLSFDIKDAQKCLKKRRKVKKKKKERKAFFTYKLAK